MNMSNLDKYFVLYNEALELKKLGFDEECFGFYEFGTFIYWYDSKQEYEFLLNCTAPLYSQVFDWFEEKYGLVPSIGLCSNAELGKTYIITNTFKKAFADYLTFPLNEVYKTSYDVRLACLKKLIEIVKEQQ